MDSRGRPHGPAASLNGEAGRRFEKRRAALLGERLKARPAVTGGGDDGLDIALVDAGCSAVGGESPQDIGKDDAIPSDLNAGNDVALLIDLPC